MGGVGEKEGVPSRWSAGYCSLNLLVSPLYSPPGHASRFTPVGGRVAGRLLFVLCVSKRVRTGTLCQSLP